MRLKVTRYTMNVEDYLFFLFQGEICIKISKLDYVGFLPSKPPRISSSVSEGVYRVGNLRDLLGTHRRLLCAAPVGLASN